MNAQTLVKYFQIALVKGIKLAEWHMYKDGMKEWQIVELYQVWNTFNAGLYPTITLD